MDERQKKVKVDLLVQLLEPDQFSIKFNDTGAKNLVSTRLLDFFTNTNRLAIIDTKLNANPSKVVTFEKCVTKLGVDTDHAEDIFCPPPPQRIKLPFKCDTKNSNRARGPVFLELEARYGKG